MDDKTPPGERDVFNFLSVVDPSWVVIHSLDLSPLNNDLRTEIDFLIIIPDVGVVCVEVKSHKDIYFDGTRWNPPTIARSPFKQAVDACYTFRRQMIDIDPDKTGIPVVHMCIFPRSPFPLSQNISIQPWELIEGAEFSKITEGHQLASLIKKNAIRSIRANRSISSLTRSLTNSEIDEVVNLCVPMQRARPAGKQELEYRAKKAEEALRTQQRPVLTLAERNRSLIVSGGAGTGKTLIAMELARRLSETGRRVALVCFNQLIGDWMANEIARESASYGTLIAGRAIRVLAKLTGVKIPSQPGQKYWDVDLPEEVTRRLADVELRAAAAFDVLIVDEAPDVLGRPWIWSALLSIVTGGEENGQVILFGDFDNQILSNRDEVVSALRKFETVAYPVKWHLSENCRNYGIVGDAALRLSGIVARPYSDYMRGQGELRCFDICFYREESEQIDKVQAWIRELRQIGFSDQEITLLSFVSDDFSLASKLQRQGMKLRPAWATGYSVNYSSVRAFKGRESKAIILTDIALRDEEADRSLFYTGVTRAVEVVRIACNWGDRERLLRWMSEGSEDE